MVGGCLIPKDPQQNDEQKVGWAHEDSDEQESGEGHRGHEAALCGKDRVNSMPAVELTNRQEIQRRHEESDPSRIGHFVEIEIGAFRPPPGNNPFHHFEYQWVAQYEGPLHVRSAVFGRCNSDEGHRQGNDESRDWTGRGDVEQRPAVGM